MRLLGAIRLSRYRGEADPTTSPERQEATIVDFAAQRGDTIVDWARDLDVSAITRTPFDRPELGDWLQNRKKEFDGIVWAKLDRAVRKIGDLHKLAVWASENKKVLVIASGPGAALKLDMTDPMSQVILTLLAFAAQMEGDAIRERNKGTREHLRSLGRWPGGMYPYHAMPVKKGNGWWLVRNDETWPIVEEIIDRVLRRESKLSIATDLNKRGIPSPREYRNLLRGEKITTAPVTGVVVASHEEAQFRKRKERFIKIDPGNGGDPVKVQIFPRHAELAVVDGEVVTAGTRLTLPILWNSKTILEMLRAPALIGQQEVRGKPVLGEDGMPVKRIEAIIESRETWERLQKVLDEKSVPSGKTRTVGASLLLDIGLCSHCGSKMHRRLNNKTEKKTYNYYGCRSKWGGVPRQEKSERCTAVAIRSEVLESAVETVLLGEIGHMEITERRVIEGMSYADELRDAEAALAHCIDESAGKSPAVRRIWEGKIAALEERINSLVALGGYDGGEDRVEYVSTGISWQEFWPTATLKQRHEKLLAAGITVFVGKGGELPLMEEAKETNRQQNGRPAFGEIDTVSGHKVCVMFEGDIASRLVMVR